METHTDARPILINGKLGFSLAETSDIIGVTQGLLFRMMKDGEIPVAKFGDRTIVPAWWLAQKMRVPEVAVDTAEATA